MYCVAAWTFTSLYLNASSIQLWSWQHLLPKLSFTRSNSIFLICISLRPSVPSFHFSCSSWWFILTGTSAGLNCSPHISSFLASVVTETTSFFHFWRSEKKKKVCPKTKCWDWWWHSCHFNPHPRATFIIITHHSCAPLIWWPLFYTLLFMLACLCVIVTKLIMIYLRSCMMSAYRAASHRVIIGYYN